MRGAVRPENRVAAMSKPPQKKWTGLALPTNRPRNSVRTRWACTSESQKRWMASRS